MTCILVVEDEDTVREVIEEVLREVGFKVVGFATADDAVTLLNDEKLLLIVADINLPGRLNGIDLALAANASRPDVAVIFVSGRPAMLDEARTVCAGASFFQKPFSFKEFINET